MCVRHSHKYWRYKMVPLADAVTSIEIPTPWFRTETFIASLARALERLHYIDALLKQLP